MGCGSGSVSGSGLDPDSIGSVDPDPEPGGQKLPTKVEKNLKFHVLKCWMASFESCFLQFLVIKPWIRIGIQPKMLDLDPDPDEMNADPQPKHFPSIRRWH
jgi:hypothetical protein